MRPTPRLSTTLAATVLALAAALASAQTSPAPQAAPASPSSPPSATSAAAQNAAHAAKMAKEHQHDTAAASPATVPPPAQAVAAEEIAYATLDGVTVKGYFVRPSQVAPGGKALPALIVIQEWWGLNDNIRAMARRFAGEGYAVLAVDLYEGKVATTSEAAMATMQGAMEKPARLLDNLRQAHTFLATQAGATRIGVVGWCFGGGWALETALAIPDGIDAAVMYYGRTQSDPKALAPLQAPLLGLFGGKDEGIPVDGVRQMEHELVKLGKNATIVIYPEADHAFANPTGNRYLAGPATDAWEKTMAFFSQHLKN
ncbi:MAG: dienelactone hydrolase family protein [Thermoanaerobaculia bacterium]|nr:dienelactone hydrolase family protein [Thermoanaerobaculia bacterium]